MACKIIFNFRNTNLLNLIQQKRIYTRWVSRNPSKILSEESASDTHDESEVKLNIERQILKRGRDIRSKEKPQINLKFNKSPTSISSRLRKLSLEKGSSTNIESKIREPKQQNSNLSQPDPFALSSLMASEGKDESALPDLEPSTTFSNPDATYSNSKLSENISRKETSEKSVNFAGLGETNSRLKQKPKTPVNWPPRLVRTEEGDRRLSQLMLQAKSKKLREKYNLVVIEGKRLINDFIQAGAIPKTLFFSRQKDVDGICVSENNTELCKVTYKQLSLWTNVETSQGVLGIFEKSQIAKQKPSEDSLPITVICDNVRDPGNLGTVLRIAACAGCENVLLTKGCVDAWDSKVLRSAAGGHCHLPILTDLSWEAVCEHLPRDCVTFAADSSPSPNGATPLVHYNKADFSSASHLAFVVGGETHGLSSSALSLASARLHVPISHGIDSLNTATAFAIIVFEARRILTAGS